jgi:hypothetical protein
MNSGDQTGRVTAEKDPRRLDFAEAFRAGVTWQAQGRQPVRISSGCASDADSDERGQDG